MNPGREVSKIEEDVNVCKKASKTQKEKLNKLKDHVAKAKERLENMKKEVTGIKHITPVPWSFFNI